MRIRNIQVNIRMTENEIEKIKGKAKKASMTFSNYVISSAMNNEVIVIEDIKGFTRQLSKVGTNINQLTVLCHQGKITSPDISVAGNLLNEIWEYLVDMRRKKRSPNKAGDTCGNC